MTLGPEQAAELLKQATALHRKGRVAEAAALYNQLLAQYPSHPDLLNLSGVAAHQMGDAAAAERLLALAVKQRPDNAEARNNYANILQAAGRPAEARAELQAALTLRPDYHEAQRNLGNLLQQEGDLAGAAAAYRRALELEPGNAQTLVYLGNVLSGQEDLAGAEDCYRLAITAQPGFARAHNDLGAVLQKLGCDAEAADSIEQAASLDPEDAQTQFNLGCIRMSQSRSEAAADAFRAAALLDPGHPKALYQLAMVERALGRIEASGAALRRLLDLKPEHASARHMLDALEGRATAIAPRAHIRQIFDDYAPHFEQHLMEGLDYRAPEALRQLADRYLAAAAPGPGRNPAYRRGLDLGCGTGLVARRIHGLAAAMDGIDLAPRMLAAAAESGLYEALYEGDLMEFFRGDLGPLPAYDLVTSADTFIYIGDLDPVFGAVSALLPPGGCYLFSLEDLKEGDFALLPTGRYAQSRGYIERLAGRHGFRLEARDEFDLRQEFNQAIPGAAYLLLRD